MNQIRGIAITDTDKDAGKGKEKKGKEKGKESAFPLLPALRLKGILDSDSVKGISVFIKNNNLTPFEFFKTYLAELYKAQKEAYEFDAARMTEILGADLMTAHVIEVDKRLIPLIERTKNQIFYRPLMFKKLFVDANFQIGDYVLRGIMIVDKVTDWYIETAVRHVPSDNGTMVVSGLLKDYKIDYGHPGLNREIDGIIAHLRTMACNFVDLVENSDEDVSVTTIVPTREQQDKRTEKKKPRIPTKI